MGAGRDGASRLLVTAVLVAVVLVGVGTFAIDGSAAIGIDDPAERAPHPAKEGTPEEGRDNDDRTTTDGADETGGNNGDNGDDENDESPTEEAPADEPAEDSRTTVSPFEGIGRELPAEVTFDDQLSDGSTVAVDSATLPDGGYVVIHGASLYQGEIEGSVLGASDRLDAGTYEDLTIALEPALVTEQPLIAVLYRESEGPTPYTHENGTALTDSAFVSVPGEGTDTDGDTGTTPPANTGTTANASESESRPRTTAAPRTPTQTTGPFAEIGTETRTATATATRTATETTSPAAPFADTETETTRANTGTRADAETTAGASDSDTPANARATDPAGATAGDAGEEETTRTEAPGFGVVSALVALLGVGFVLRRRQ